MTPTNTPDLVDSHQASEDELLQIEADNILTSIAASSDENGHIDRQTRLFGRQMIYDIIRTEQKKLLAAVGERVIGTDTTPEQDSWHTANNRLRAEQRAIYRQIMEEL